MDNKEERRSALAAAWTVAKLALVAIAAATVLLAGIRPSAAGYYGYGSPLWNYYDQPWCLSAADLNDCSYANFSQCNVARSGTGGSCYPNPRYSDRPQQRGRAKAKRRRS